MAELLIGTSHTIQLGPYLDSTDGVTPENALTITAASVWVSKAGGIFAAKTHSAACAADSIALGYYACELDGTDCGITGLLAVYSLYSGATPVWHHFDIVSQLRNTHYTQMNALAASTALTAYNAPTHAEVSSALTAITTQMTAQAASTALTAYAPLTATQGNAIAASLALTAYDPPTKAEMDTAVAAQGASLALTAYAPLTTTHADAIAASTALTDYGAATTTHMDALAASTALTAYDSPTDTEMLAVVRAHSASLALTAYAPLTATQGNALAASLALTAYAPLTTTHGDAIAASTALAAYTGVTTALVAYDAALKVWSATRASHVLTGSFGKMLASGVQKNTAFSNLMFLMVDSTDHRTPKTGLTVTGYVSIDAAAFGACATSIVEVANGYYQYDAQAADLNGGTCTFRFAATGADDTGVTVITS